MAFHEPNILFVANGRSKKLDKFRKELSKNRLYDYVFRVTTFAGEAKDLVSDCTDFTHVVAIGGDGTIHEIVNGVLNVVGENSPPIIGLLTGGSANDFKKSFNGPSNLAELFEAIRSNKTFDCDVGHIFFEKSRSEKYFINIADAGIGAMVVEEVNSQSKKINASITFFRAIIKSFRKYHNISIRCETDEWEWSGKMKMLAISNGQYFGSGLKIAPHAHLNDGKLAITIGANISTFDYIKNLPSLKQGAYIKHPQLFYKEARSIRITSEERCSLEADGEIMPDAPFTIKILPSRLKFLGSL